METMCCPLCRSTLIAGDLRRYETTDEHVGDPNGDHGSTPRPTWICGYRECVTHASDTFWVEDGDGPFSSTYTIRSLDRCYIDNNPHPFNSWSRSMYFQIYYKEEDRRTHLGKLMIIKEVRYQSNSHGDKVGKTVRHTFWWNGFRWIPGWRMLLYVLKRFYHYRSGAKEGDYLLLQEVRDIFQSATYPRAEWWRKVSAWWIGTFHKKVAIEALSCKEYQGDRRA